MLFKSVAAAAALAVATQAASDVAVPVHMSVRDLFGAVHPRDDAGYEPTQDFCAMGTSCAEACGAGYDMCPSDDQSIHCYNPSAKASCCAGGKGVSCDAGFYCANNAKGEQLCCPEGKSLAECEGAVVSVAALPSSTSTSSASPTSAVSSTVTPSSLVLNSTVTAASNISVKATPSAGFPVSLNGTIVGTTPTRGPGGFTSAAPTPTSVADSAGNVVGPSATIFGLAAVALAALL